VTKLVYLLVSPTSLQPFEMLHLSYKLVVYDICLTAPKVPSTNQSIFENSQMVSINRVKMLPPA